MENGHFAILSPLGNLGETYDVCLRLIGKRVMDFLLVLIELFLLGATAEALRANTTLKIGVFFPTGQLDTNFQVEGVAQTNHSS